MTSYRAVSEGSPPADADTLQVTWARLPVLWWRDIPVIAVEPAELNALDQFVIAATKRLCRLDSELFTEYTGLPEYVFVALARRLRNLGLLGWESDALTPMGSAPGTGETVGERRCTRTLDFLYLPGTGDLVAVENGLSDFERTGPRITSAAPLPPELHDVTVRELLSSRIQQRNVAGLAPDVVELGEFDDEPLTQMAGAKPAPPIPVCPVIECTGTISLSDPPTVTLDIGRRATRRGSDQEAGMAVSLDLGQATGLIDAWAQVGREPGPGVAEALGLRPRPERSVRWLRTGLWELFIDEADARLLAPERLLTVLAGVEVRERHVWMTAAVLLAPEDPKATQLVRRDAVLQQLLAHSDDIAQAVARDPEAVLHAGGRAALMGRAWQLRQFPVVHALREAEDFAYA